MFDCFFHEFDCLEDLGIIRNSQNKNDTEFTHVHLHLLCFIVVIVVITVIMLIIVLKVMAECSGGPTAVKGRHRHMRPSLTPHDNGFVVLDGNCHFP